MAMQQDVPEDKIKRAIVSLPDVHSCNVEFNPDGTIAAVHIVSSTKRPPKQIVRDIESVMLADFGIKVDHRKISIARVEDRDEARHPRAQRPKLVGIKSSNSAGKGTVEVSLERAGLAVSGEAAGVAWGGGLLRLVAQATFRALEKLVGQDAAFELLDVVRVKSGERQAVVVFANFAGGSEARALAGCVQCDEDDQRATALAALDASNRIIELLSQPEQTEYEVSPFPED
ncbi:MAG: hypothetical protein WAW06_11335 [bacterium]